MQIIKPNLPLASKEPPGYSFELDSHDESLDLQTMLGRLASEQSIIGGHKAEQTEKVVAVDDVLTRLESQEGFQLSENERVFAQKYTKRIAKALSRQDPNFVPVDLFEQIMANIRYGIDNLELEDSGKAYTDAAAKMMYYHGPKQTENFLNGSTIRLIAETEIIDDEERRRFLDAFPQHNLVLLAGNFTQNYEEKVRDIIRQMKSFDEIAPSTIDESDDFSGFDDRTKSNLKNLFANRKVLAEVLLRTKASAAEILSEKAQSLLAIQRGTEDSGIPMATIIGYFGSGILRQKPETIIRHVTRQAEKFSDYDRQGIDQDHWFSIVLSSKDSTELEHNVAKFLETNRARKTRRGPEMQQKLDKLRSSDKFSDSFMPMLDQIGTFARYGSDLMHAAIEVADEFDPLEAEELIGGILEIKELSASFAKQIGGSTEYSKLLSDSMKGAVIQRSTEVLLLALESHRQGEVIGYSSFNQRELRITSTKEVMMAIEILRVSLFKASRAVEEQGFVLNAQNSSSEFQSFSSPGGEVTLGIRAHSSEKGQARANWNITIEPEDIPSKYRGDYLELLAGSQKANDKKISLRIDYDNGVSVDVGQAYEKIKGCIPGKLVGRAITVGQHLLQQSRGYSEHDGLHVRIEDDEIALDQQRFSEALEAFSGRLLIRALGGN